MSIRVNRWLWENNPECVVNYIQQGINLEDRCTGKSTGVALGIIAECMQHPSRSVKVRETGIMAQDRFLFDVIKQLVHKLELKGFSFCYHNMTVKYYPWVELKMKITLEEV
jgi:hypothetical protein